jgi:hypothetical protein
MKLCQCCGTPCRDDQFTCPLCGEASWSMAGQAKTAAATSTVDTAEEAEPTVEAKPAEPTEAREPAQRQPQSYNQSRHGKGRR